VSAPDIDPVHSVEYFPAAVPTIAPACSICIANYNGTALLQECLASIHAQKGSASVEVIIHDDASTDGSVEWIRRRYPNVELLASHENVGFAIANNRMVAHARGEYVLLLNNDAALFSDALQALVTESAKRARPGILTLPQYDWKSGQLVDRGCRLDPFYNPVPNLEPSRGEVAITIGACLLIPRALWNELGGFPEWIGSIAEDMYICCLARLRGYAVAVTPASGYRHRQGASFGGNRVDEGKLKTTFRRRALSERNKTAVMVICTPTALVWPLLALHFLALAIEGAGLAALTRSARVWREIYCPTLGYILRAPRGLRSLRRKAQSARRVGLREYLRGFVLMPRKLVLLRRYGVPSVK
jgi:GT2 family glycosyltransferase